MTRSASPHAPSIHPSTIGAGAPLPDARREVVTDRRKLGAAFLEEIAALEALDDAAFADVLPDVREPIVATVVGRGRVDP